MKVSRSLSCALVAASALSLALFAVGAVAAETPFKGTVNADETSQVVFPTAFVDRVGTGNATYLGRYTEHVLMQINIPTLTSTGTATFTAANGDTLFASAVGRATPAGPTVLSIVEVYTITGGTGRFANATGSFTLESTLDRTTGISAGAFTGAIELSPQKYEPLDREEPRAAGRDRVHVDGAREPFAQAVVVSALFPVSCIVVLLAASIGRARAGRA